MEIEKLKNRLLEWDGVDTVDNGEFTEVNYHGVFDLLREAADALKQLQAENNRLKEKIQQMRWIPVEERLPEEKQRVIVRCERVGTSVGWILWGNWMTDIGPGAGKVTHWMPLPQPPARRPPDGEKEKIFNE